MRYFSRGIGELDAGRKDMLLDIATGELSHHEVIGSIVAMLNRGVKAQLSEPTMEEAELYSAIMPAVTAIPSRCSTVAGPRRPIPQACHGPPRMWTPPG